MDTRLAESTDERERVPLPSETVRQLLTLDGVSSACAGTIALSGYRIRRRENESHSYFLDVYVGKRHVQIYVSPTGRSVRVYVDGDEV